MQSKVLQRANDCATIEADTAATKTQIQLTKFMRRVMALDEGRHEIIITVASGVQDWTVRTIGKVEK